MFSRGLEMAKLAIQGYYLEKLMKIMILVCFIIKSIKKSPISILPYYAKIDSKTFFECLKRVQR